MKDTISTPNRPTREELGIHKPALSREDIQRARRRRIRRNVQSEDELAYERGAAIADDHPHHVAWAMAGLMSSRPSLQSAFVLIGAMDERNCYRWASAVVDFGGYFGAER